MFAYQCTNSDLIIQCDADQPMWKKPAGCVCLYMFVPAMWLYEGRQCDYRAKFQDGL